MEHVTPQSILLAEIDAHLAATGLSKSAFGQQALGDPRFVFDLEAGRECRFKTAQKVREFMASSTAPETEAQQ